MTTAVATRMYVYISGAWTQLNALSPARLYWGINDNRPTSRLADVGELTFALNNADGLYTPGGASMLSGWQKGLPVKMVVTFEGQDFVRFRGNITDIKIRPNNKDKKAYITVSDWLDYTVRHPIVNPTVQSDQSGDEVITTILSELEVQPQGQSLGTGTETFPTAFDDVKDQTTAYQEFAKIANSELGYIYVTKDRTNGETLVFEGSDARHGWIEPDTRSLTTYTVDPNPGKLLLETGDYLLLETGDKLILDADIQNDYTFDGTMDGNDISDFDAVYGEHVINRITVYAYPRRLSASNEILFQLDKEIVIPPGGVYELRGTYADPNGGLPIGGSSMVTPVATTDYTMYRGTGGTGTNTTAYLDITMNYGAEGFIAQLENTDSYPGYVNKFNTRGIGIYKYNPISSPEEDATSLSNYGTGAENIYQKYKTTLYSASAFSKTVIDDNKDAKTVLNSISFCANKSSSNMLAFLYTDVGDMIYLDINELGISGNYYIQGVEMTINGGIAFCKLVLISTLSAQALTGGLTSIAMDFDNYYSVIDYGHLPKVSSPDTRTFSTWVYVDALSGPRIVFSITFGSTVNVSMYFYDSRVYYSHYFSSATGAWGTNQNPTGFTANTWVHMAITFDKSSSSNDPIIYINGNSVTVNELSTPSGNAVNESGAFFNIGSNLYEGGYANTLDGKLYDTRVYNRILSATEVTTLYNSGMPDETLVTSGLVFQGFNVRTADLADYTDQTLTSSLKVRDNIFGAIGTPGGSPIGRSAP